MLRCLASSPDNKPVKKQIYARRCASSRLALSGRWCHLLGSDSFPSDSLFKASHAVPSHLPLLLYVVPCGGRVGVWRGRWAGRGGELSGRSSEVTEPTRRRRSGHSASRQCSNMASSSRGIQIGSAWVQRKIKLRPQHRGIHLVTDEVLKEIPELRQFSVGLLHVQSK